jgi:hypothetical protein
VLVCVRARTTPAGLACLRSAHPHLTSDPCEQAGPGAPPRWSSRPGEPFAGLPKCFEGAGRACRRPCPAPWSTCPSSERDYRREVGQFTRRSPRSRAMRRRAGSRAADGRGARPCSCKPCAFGVRGQAVARLSTSALLACVGTDAPECSSSACTQVPLHVLWCVANRACLVPLVQVGEDGVLTEEPLNQRLAVAGGSCP